MAGERKRRGPRPRGPFEDKRRTLTTRITDATRRELEAARKATGRSLSQEIEFRLDQSFRKAETLADTLGALFGGARGSAIHRRLSEIAYLQTGVADWADETETFFDVIDAWQHALPQVAKEMAPPVGEQAQWMEQFLKSSLEAFKQERLGADKRSEIGKMLFTLSREGVPHELRAEIDAALDLGLKDNGP